MHGTRGVVQMQCGADAVVEQNGLNEQFGSTATLAEFCYSFPGPRARAVSFPNNRLNLHNALL